MSVGSSIPRKFPLTPLNTTCNWIYDEMIQTAKRVMGRFSEMHEDGNRTYLADIIKKVFMNDLMYHSNNSLVAHFYI